MDKTTLHKIFNKAFDDASWLEVLKSVFGAKLGLLAQPMPLMNWEALPPLTTVLLVYTKLK